MSIQNLPWTYMEAAVCTRTVGCLQAWIIWWTQLSPLYCFFSHLSFFLFACCIFFLSFSTFPSLSEAICICGNHTWLCASSSPTHKFLLMSTHFHHTLCFFFFLMWYPKQLPEGLITETHTGICGGDHE